MSAVPKVVENEVVGELVENNFPAEVSNNIVGIDHVEAWLMNVEDEYAKVPDVTTKEGMKLARSRRREIVGFRNSMNDFRKAATKPFRDLVARINGRCNDDITPRLLAVEEKYDETIKAEEARIAEEKERKKKVEEERVQAIEELIGRIKTTLDRVSSPDDIGAERTWLNSLGSEDFAEFADTGNMYLDMARSSLDTRAKEYEEEARQEAEREKERQAEEKRRKEEQARLDKEREAQEARQKEQDEREAELQRKQDEIDRQAQKLKDEAEAKEKADREAEAEKERAEKAKKAAEEKRKQDEADEKARKERLAELKPEAEKLSDWLQSIRSIKPPKVKTEEADAVLRSAAYKFEELALLIEAMEGN